MSEAERDTLNAWDVFKPTADKFTHVGAMLRGAGMLAKSRFGDMPTLARLVEAHAARRPQHPAVTFENQQISYAQFNATANRYARTLKNAGIGAGDVVALLIDNRPATLMLVAALAKIGAAAAMCNTKQRGNVLAHSLGAVEPRAMLVGAEFRAVFDEVRAYDTVKSLSPVWMVNEKAAASVAEGYQDFLAAAADQPSGNLDDSAAVSSDATCFFIFTSGTTGMPKASRMSHKRWLRAGAGMGLLGLRLKPEDRFYCPLPLYHNNALTVCWSSVLCAGATLSLARRFSVSAFWDDIRHHKATVFCYIGELCRYLLQAADGDEHDHAVRAVIGNGLRPDIWDAFKARFGIERICEFYGASEGNLAFVNGFNVDRTAGFCPLPFAVVNYDPETERPVTDDQGHMIQVARGEVGLLLSKVTDFMPFEGYTDPEAGEKKLFRNVFKQDDCYFNTGDLVRRQGVRHIAFVDRLGDTFRWKGENVATTQVENAINAFDGVEESVVYGVAVPGADGRAGMAALTPVGAEDAFDWDGLAQHLRQTLPGYAVPVFARITPEQDVTGTMKYRKVDLKEDGYAPESGDTVWWLDGKTGNYQPIDESLRRELDAGQRSL